MSQFTTPAVLKLLDSYKWCLSEPVEYYSEILTNTLELEILAAGHIIKVPIGYVSDLTSVPRLLWSVFPPNGRYAKAAIVHDYLYSNAIATKAFADDIFLEAMTVLDVPRWRRLVMYWAVRLFGRGAYAKDGHV